MPPLSFWLNQFKLLFIPCFECICAIFANLIIFVLDVFVKCCGKMMFAITSHNKEQII